VTGQLEDFPTSLADICPIFNAVMLSAIGDNSIEKPGLQAETLPNKEILRKPTETLNKKPTYGSYTRQAEFQACIEVECICEVKK
jgi:hypothetical protein